MMPELPPGWRPHDGGPCPVPLDSRPAVLFRDGMRIDNHLTAASEWTFAETDSDLWRWPERHGPADIIAYLPEEPTHDDA